MASNKREWVEVKGATVEVAVEAALEALGIEDPDRVDVEVRQEPKLGFLGIGRQDALVMVKPKRRRSRGRTRRKSPSRAKTNRADQGKQKGKSPTKPSRSSTRGTKQLPDGSQSADSSRARDKKARKQAKGSRKAEREVKAVKEDNKSDEALLEHQTQVVEEFLTGLLAEFGLEGEVDTRFEGKAIYVDVTGDQTEALIGPKASVMQAVHELTRTIVQRKTSRGCRLRLDIAGYNARRREALTIYAGKLAEQVLEEGGEIMLEPMNSADRKVVHDAIADIDGTRSYSEGSEPRRSVVISLD
ncbi:MAG: Jag N-terminal domain-containing protein [bacterium]|nr:Jag N-terminal domain-containing protein [bacterium]